MENTSRGVRLARPSRTPKASSSGSSQEGMSSLWGNIVKAPWTRMPNAKVSQPKAKKQLRRRSKAYESRMKEYRKAAAEFLKRHPLCAVFPSQASAQVHHKFGRGKFLMWEPGWVQVSLDGHRWIDSHREEARARGLLAARGEWQNYKVIGQLKNPPNL